MITVKCYKTNDGTIFENRSDAVRYETKDVALDYLESNLPPVNPTAADMLAWLDTHEIKILKYFDATQNV